MSNTQVRLLYSPTFATNVLRLLWVVFIVWGELGTYFWSLSSCRWPVHATTGSEPLQVLLISDTQIRPPLLLQSSSLLPRVRGFLVDLFLRKSWHVTSRLKPRVVFFLGDMINGKSIQSGVQYSELVQKFKSMFLLEASTSVYYLPGNSDVGMGAHMPQSKDIRAYYEKHFGPLNEVITLKNHTFFVLDAPGLVDEDYLRNTRGVSFHQWEPNPGGTVEAVKNAASRGHHPVVLLSHIPLYRPDTAPCGPLREKGTIRRGVGHGYQNTLRKQTTEFLMQVLEPDLIFSGDNRDYCEYVHKGTSFGVSRSIPEITVKSFSPAPQIRRPGFQLLSVIDPTNVAPSEPSFLHRPCLLPDYSAIFSMYTWWSIVTFCILLALNTQRSRRFRRRKPFELSLTPSSSHSNHTSPAFEDTNTLSPFWSPHTLSPFIPSTSPRAPISSSFRTPMAPATPTFRASSQAIMAQDYDSPMLSPQLIPASHDEEDSMFPDQYSVHRQIRHPRDEEWTPIRREDFDPNLQATHATDEVQQFNPPPQFISAPGNQPTHHRRRSSWSPSPPWSWTFVLNGRRRRISFRLPTLSACWRGCKDVVEFLRYADGRILLFQRRRGIVASTLIESFSVIWPAMVMWLIINCWMF